MHQDTLKWPERELGVLSFCNTGTKISLRAMVKRLMSDKPKFNSSGSLRPTKYAYWLTIKLNSQTQPGNGYLPFRTYIWKAKSGATSYCYGYGEQNWMRGKTWNAANASARGDRLHPPVGRIACP